MALYSLLADRGNGPKFLASLRTTQRGADVSYPSVSPLAEPRRTTLKAELRGMKGEKKPEELLEVCKSVLGSDGGLSGDHELKVVAESP